MGSGSSSEGPDRNLSLQQCCEIITLYNVIPGYSYGNLPKVNYGIESWDLSDCNDKVGFRQGHFSDRSPNCHCGPNDWETHLVDDVHFHLNNPSSEPAIGQNFEASVVGENHSKEAAPMGTITSQITQTSTKSMQFDSTTGLSVSTSIKAGIPDVAEGTVTAGAEQTFHYGHTITKSSTIAVTMQTSDVSIPPQSWLSVEFKGQIFTYRVPFTATASQRNRCGGSRTTTTTGHAVIEGVAAMVSGTYKTIISVAIPIECKSPLGIPIEEQITYDFCGNGGPKCSDNVMCKRQKYPGNNGICCEQGVYEDDCCAQTKFHSGMCHGLYKNASAICPFPNGEFAACCTGKRTTFLSKKPSKGTAYLKVLSAKKIS
eukprot:Pgem_evm1s2105